jgi:hypothetical protein
MQMRNRIIGATVATAAMFAVVSLASVLAAGQQEQAPRARPSRPPAGPVHRLPNGQPDIVGTWRPSAAGSGQAPLSTNILEAHGAAFGVESAPSSIIDPPEGIIPYQPWALAERNRRREPGNSYEDPWAKCFLPGIPHHLIGGFTVMRQTPEVIIMEGTGESVRSIYMDGRPHLPDRIRLWMGDSLGHWEGDTLVIETTNFNGKTWIVLGGDFTSADAKVTERMAVVDANTINWTATVDDPKAFTRPWTMMASGSPTLRAQREPEPLEGWNSENNCHEGNVDLVHLKGAYDLYNAKNKK